MSDAQAPAPTGEDRCWPCAIANAAAGLVVATVPLLAAVARDDATLLALALLWTAAVAGYTVYRLLARGYLPYSETVARLTGLHDRLGPGKKG